MHDNRAKGREEFSIIVFILVYFNLTVMHQYNDATYSDLLKLMSLYYVI